MNRLVALAGSALLLSASAAQAASQPSWAPLVAPEIAKGEVAPELRACFKAHRTWLAGKPNDLAPLVKDYDSGDAMKRDCALAAQADFMMGKYKTSSPLNSYGPLIGGLSAQNKAASAKGAEVACPTRRLMLDAARQFDALLGGFPPDVTYDWLVKAGNPAC